MAAMAERQAVALRAAPSTEAGQPLLGEVLEVLESALVRVRLSRVDTDFVIARCLEHVVARRGGLASLVGEQVLVVAIAGDWARAVVCGVIARESQSASVDGKRIMLEASQEIVLQCGKGSITLTADGRIVIKGVEVVSRAMRANKIKGGTVNIN